jgi:hypothetical protein
VSGATTLPVARSALASENRSHRWYSTFTTREKTMTPLRGLIAGCTAAVVLAFAASTPVEAGCFGRSAECCAPAPVCCPPPPPVSVRWCVEDPCSCCKYEVSACVPACCAGTIPCLVDCRKGIFGRKVLTYKFPCCDHCVEVVITHFGRTIVRD